MKQLIVRMSDEDFLKLKAYCESRNKSQKEIVNESLKKYINENPLNEIEQTIYNARLEQAGLSV